MTIQENTATIMGKEGSKIGGSGDDDVMRSVFLFF